MLPLLQIEVERLKIKSHVLTLNMLPVPIYICMFFFLLIHTQFQLQQEVIQTQGFSTLIIDYALLVTLILKIKF